MITFSSNVQNALSQPAQSTFELVKIGANYHTTYFRDLSMTGGNTYIADGLILSVDMPQLSSTVDRQLYQLIVAKEMFSLAAISVSGMLGTPVEVRIGFIDFSTKVPFTNIADTILIYGGKIDTIGLNLATAQYGESAYTIKCASPMSDLDLTKAYYTSQDYLNKRYPNDRAYEQVYEGSSQINLRWGKI